MKQSWFQADFKEKSGENYLEISRWVSRSKSWLSGKERLCRSASIGKSDKIGESIAR